MPNERFTDLPTVGSAAFTDIICAVQGYVSPSIIGTSVQESLLQIFQLFQSNVILSNAGNPNGSVAGSTYQLCWDTTNHILYVCTQTGTASTAVWMKSITLTAGTGISITQSGSNIVISGSASGISWNKITATTQAMVTNNGYIADAGSLLTFTLPTTASIGDSLIVTGLGAGGWTITQAAGQQIIIGSAASTVGVSGSISSSNQFDAFSLVCVTANSVWQTLSGPQGNLTIV